MPTEIPAEPLPRAPGEARGELGPRAARAPAEGAAGRTIAPRSAPAVQARRAEAASELRALEIPLPPEEAGENRAPRAFWILTFALVLYVALLTGQRQNHWMADAWEHHRAIRALTVDLFDPGNPTFATDEPSIRYSPYTLVLAVLCRTTGLDPYDAQSLAAVVNTLLLALGLWALLKSYGEARSAAACLAIMVILYGGVPHHANSYSLSDLPWLQVNPAAWAFALTLLAWTAFRRFQREGWKDYSLPAVALLTTTAFLDHGPTAIFCFLGLGVLMLLGRGTWLRSLGGLSVVVGVTALLALAWPWFSVLQIFMSRAESGDGITVDTLNPDRGWFVPHILKRTFTVWCAPALVAGLCVFGLRRRPITRFCILGAVACFGLGALAFVVPSMALSRLPLPGIVFLHVAVGLYAYQTGLLRPGTWGRRLRELFRGTPRQATERIPEIWLALLLVYCLAPKAWAIAREPHLARAWVAPLTGKENKQLDLKDRLDRLLVDVGERDVVLADQKTGWPVPSSTGRIVSALHGEFFVRGQRQRRLDVEEFFARRPPELARASEIIETYDVRWILISRKSKGKDEPNPQEQLIEPAAIRADDGDFVLMDARAWLQARAVE